MADPVTPPNDPAVVSPPAVAEVAESVAAPAAGVETPAVEVATPAEAPAAEAPKTVAETPSLMEEAAAPGETEKPAETEAPKPAEEPAKPADPAKPAETAKPAEEAAKPVEPAAPAEPAKPVALEYKYELPGVLAMTDAQKGELHGALDAYRADQANAQPLIDYHVARLTDFANRVQREQQDSFLNTRAEWAKSITGDEEMGGSGFETTKKAVARMRDFLVSAEPKDSPKYAEHLREFNQMLRITGAGDHPAMWRMLHTAARFFDQPQANEQPVDIRPPPNGRAPGSRRAAIYDHPTSPNNRNG